MDTNINILNINKHFFSNKEQILDSNYRNKIVNYSHFSANEAKICHKIKKIPYYSNFFSILEDYEALNISQLNDDIIEKLKNIGNMQYYLFKYNDRDSVNFIDFLYNFTSIKKLILDNINAFKHILYGLHILNDINISHILNKLEDFTYQPLEIHIIYYFTRHKITTISYTFIEEFCEEFVESLNILRLFSENYRKKYKEQCIETMRKYINRPRKDILDNILERNDKWDVYGISMIFLHIFGCISRIFSLKGTFISRITIELTRNLHPDSDKRMSLEETLNMFNKYLDEENDWKFVNNLDNNKLTQLFDELAK
jgi:hypothetical protein